MKFTLVVIFCLFSEIICTKREGGGDKGDVSKPIHPKKRWRNDYCGTNSTSVHSIGNNQEQYSPGGNVGFTRTGAPNTACMISSDNKNDARPLLVSPPISQAEIQQELEYVV
jgi:hypothetical protein